MVLGDSPPLAPPAPRSDEGVEVVALVTAGGVTLEEMPGFVAAMPLVMGGVTLTGTSHAPLVLIVEEAIPRDTLMVLTGCTVTPRISTPRVLSMLVPSGLVADPDLRSTIFEISKIELVLKKLTSQPRD